jgi:hypothetical protein
MGVKATAVREAAAVYAEREAAFAAREKQIRELVTGFFVAHGQVEQVLAAAKLRCEQIMAAAKASAEQAQSEAAGAVAGLQALGLSRQELSQVTRLKAGQVRALLAASRTPGPSEPGAASDCAEDTAAGTSQDAGAQTIPDGGSDPDPTRARPRLMGDGDRGLMSASSGRVGMAAGTGGRVDVPGPDEVSADATTTLGADPTTTRGDSGAVPGNGPAAQR